MLAGEPPFTGPTAQAIVARVMTEVPRSLRAQRHTIPEPVEAAIFTALEKLPADRFDSAAEFAEALAGGRPARRAAAAGVVKPTRTLRDRVPHLLGAALLITTALAVWACSGPAASRPARWCATI
jgi:serine/threonine-protein kinase